MSVQEFSALIRQLIHVDEIRSEADGDYRSITKELLDMARDKLKVEVDPGRVQTVKVSIPLGGHTDAICEFAFDHDPASYRNGITYKVVPRVAGLIQD